MSPQSFFKTILFCIVISSCVEPIVLDSGEVMPVVVHCVLTDSTSVQTVKLFRAARPGEEKMTPLSSDQVNSVKIADSLGAVILLPGKAGEWKGNLIPRDECLYRLDIEMKDGRKVFAETSYPKRYHYSPERGHLYRRALFPDTGEIIDNVLWYDPILYHINYTPSAGIIDPAIIGFYPNSIVWQFVIQPNYAGGVSYSDYVGLRRIVDYPTTLPEESLFNRIPALSLADFSCFSQDLGNSTGLPTYGPVPDNAEDYVFWKALRFQYGDSRLFYSDHTDYRHDLIGIYDVDYATSHKPIPNIYHYPDSLGIHFVEQQYRNPKTPILLREYHLVSKEYDAWLQGTIERGLDIMSGDVLNVLYSKKDIPSNIEGGKGIFGAEALYRVPYNYWQYNEPIELRPDP